MLQADSDSSKPSKGGQSLGLDSTDEKIEQNALTRRLLEFRFPVADFGLNLKLDVAPTASEPKEVLIARECYANHPIPHLVKRFLHDKDFSESEEKNWIILDHRGSDDGEYWYLIESCKPHFKGWIQSTVVRRACPLVVLRWIGSS
jgi:hypothetical protein